MNLIYEYPFEIDVEETDFWTNTEFNKSVLRCQTTKERKKIHVTITMFSKIQLTTRQVSTLCKKYVRYAKHFPPSAEV